MAVKLNGGETYEPLKITIDKVNTPIAYNNKIEELVEQGAYPTIEDAEKNNPSFIMDCEIYYEKGCGLFAVEEGAVESGTVFSPYTGEVCEEYHEL